MSTNHTPGVHHISKDWLWLLDVTCKLKFNICCVSVNWTWISHQVGDSISHLCRPSTPMMYFFYKNLQHQNEHHISPTLWAKHFIRGINPEPWFAFLTQICRVFSQSYLWPRLDRSFCVLTIGRNNIRLGLSLRRAWKQRPYLEDIEKLKRVVNSFRRLKIMIGIDSNARSSTWGDSVDNHRGHIIEDFISSENLFLMNDGKEPTFVSLSFVERRSFIDLTLVNQRLLKLC